MTIPLALRQEMQATEADIEELSSLAALVEGTDCAITLRELRDGVIKVSVRTGPRVNATDVCARLGGGGHRAAAGATVSGTMADAKRAVLAAIAEVAGE
jgi:phosphoesterase RecJ-like protein